MPTTTEDYQQAVDRASQLSATGSQYDSAANSLGPQVMEAVRADRVTRGVSQMATDVGNTMGQIPTDTAGIRARAGNMVNPLEVDTITASQRGQNLRTLGTIATQSEYNQGTLTDILGEHSSQLKAIAAAKLAEAQRAKDEADAIMQKLQFEEGVRQFNETLAESKAKRTGSGGGGIGDLDLPSSVIADNAKNFASYATAYREFMGNPAGLQDDLAGLLLEIQAGNATLDQAKQQLELAYGKPEAKFTPYQPGILDKLFSGLKGGVSTGSGRGSRAKAMGKSSGLVKKQ